MKISVISYSLSEQPATLSEWESKLTTEIKSLIESGSKILLYPELCLLGLSQYFPGELKEQYAKVSEYTQNTLLLSLASILKNKDVLLCLGSGPRIKNNQIFNSSPLWVNGAWIFQDKIHLTPWETDFIPGNEIQFFEFHGFNSACIICYDIEQPGISLKLKRSEIDLILVPSATASKNGNQRVNRCASARSIELGALVITSPLIGDSKCELIDHSEGRQGYFLPAQNVVTVPQEQFSEYAINKQVIHHYELETAMLKELKQRDGETKPYFKEDQILP